VGDARLQAVVVVQGGEAPLAAVEQRRGQGLVAHLRPAADIGADVAVEAEDLLQDDHPALVRREGRLMVGGELEPVGPRDLDGLGHRLTLPPPPARAGLTSVTGLSAELKLGQRRIAPGRSMA
jgi:hypothetical protein